MAGCRVGRGAALEDLRTGSFAGLPMAGLGMAGLAMAGLAMAGLGMAGLPMAGLPMAGLAMAGLAMAGLAMAGVARLDRVAQDGARVRAPGAASFCRHPALEDCREEAPQSGAPSCKRKPQAIPARAAARPQATLAGGL
ncbi:MAG: hypothetical protein ACREDA_07635 [Methylocella sp.]